MMTVKKRIEDVIVEIPVTKSLVDEQQRDQYCESCPVARQC